MKTQIVSPRFLITAAILIYLQMSTATIKNSYASLKEGSSINMLPSDSDDELFTPDCINMLNGKIIPADIVYEDNQIVLCWLKKRNSRVLREISVDEIFSITDRNGAERIVYSQDPDNEGTDLTVSQMKDYVRGMQDGKSKSLSPIITVGGIVAGTTLAVFGFWTTPIPFIYTIAVHAITSRKKHVPAEELAGNEKTFENLIANVFVQEKNHSYGMKTKYKSASTSRSNQIIGYVHDSDEYSKGYRDAVKSKKAFNSVKGIAGGFLGTAIALIIIL
ncbi:MAG: hypothetical protein V2A54_03440 [Bacteroidota bacterium]